MRLFLGRRRSTALPEQQSIWRRSTVSITPTWTTCRSGKVMSGKWRAAESMTEPVALAIARRTTWTPQRF